MMLIVMSLLMIIVVVVAMMVTMMMLILTVITVVMTMAIVTMFCISRTRKDMDNHLHDATHLYAAHMMSCHAFPARRGRRL